jgi:hypothetical protein
MERRRVPVRRDARVLAERRLLRAAGIDGERVCAHWHVLGGSAVKPVQFVVGMGAVWLVACGGIERRDREHEPVEAGVDAAWDGGDTVRRVVCDARPPTPRIPEGAQCRVDGDCEGMATCQSGKCCSGEWKDGACKCGDGDGCDLGHVCCQPQGETRARCVGSVSACGVW